MVIEELKLIIENDKKKLQNNDYVIVTSLLEKIKNLKIIKSINITEEERKYLSEEANAYLDYILDCFKMKSNIAEYKITELINYIINELNIYISNTKYVESINKLDELQNIINENIFNNYSVIFDYIKQKNNDKTINSYYASYLILELGKYICNKEAKNEDEVILEENIEDISESILDIFEKYGYDFSKLNDIIKKEILKYGKINIIEKVLKIIHENNIDQGLLLDKQKSVSRIFFDQDNKVEEIAKFSKENNLEFKELFKIDGIFHKRRKKYFSANKNKEEKISENDELVIAGLYDDFIANFKLLKQYKVDLNENDIFAQRMKRYMITPNELINKNLKLLKQYNIIKEKMPESLTSLIGIHTEYHLDRYIEMGMFNYIKNNTSKLCFPINLKHYYKIRRGQDLELNIQNKRGIASAFVNLDIGIGEKEDGSINQKKLSIEQLSSIPKYKKREISKNDYIGQRYYDVLYDKSYKYNIFEPKNILKNVANSEILIEMVNTILKNDVSTKDYYNTDNKYIKILDNKIISINDFTNYPIKLDENTYQFIPIKFPNNRILISRNKVIRIMNALEKNIFEKEELNYDEIIGIILCAITKDSILSYWELRQIRIILKYIIPTELERGIEHAKFLK